MRNVESLRTVSKWLVLIGAVNWGLVGLVDYNLVEGIFGGFPGLVRLVYVLVGVAGAWGVYGMLTKKGK